MASQELIYDLVIETKKAVLDIKSALDKSDQQAAKVGKSSGASFGNSFATAATAILGAISFNALIGGIQGALGAYREMQGANVALSGAIKFVNNQTTKTNSVLASNTASYEEKASALGLDTDKLYTNTKATQSNEGAIKSQEASIRSAERAYEDSIRVKEQEAISLDNSTKAIDRQIKSLNKQTEEQIKQIRIKEGYDAIDNDLKALEIQKNQYEIQKDTALLAGDGTAVNQAQNEINLLNVKISLRKNELDDINFKTDAIKDQAKVQEDAFKNERDSLITKIEDIRSELSIAKNKFDIDIEPAKRKLEDLRATNVSVGGGKVISEEMKKFIDQASEKAKINIPAKINEDDVNKSIESVKKKFQVKGKDIISTATFKQAYGDLLKGGVTSLDAVEKTVTQFIESASVGRSAGVSLEKAVGNLGYAFRTNNSQIGNLSGIQENWSDITKDGTAQLEAQYIAMGDLDSARRVSLGLLTDEEQVKAKLIGLDKVTQDTTGAFTDLAKTGALDTEIFNQQLKTFQQVLGEKLLPVLGKIIPPLADILDKVIEFTKNNPQFVTGVLLAVTAFTGLLTAGLALAPVIGAIAGLFNPVTLAIGLVVLAIGGLVTWLNGSGGLAEAGKVLKDIWEKDVNPALTRLKTILDDTWKFLSATFQPTFDVLIKSFKDDLLPVLKSAWDSFYQLYLLLEPYIMPILKTLGVVIGVTLVTAIVALGVVLAGLALGWKLTFDGIKWTINTVRAEWDKFTTAIKKGWEFAFNGLGTIAKTALNAVVDEVNKSLKSFNDLGDGFEKATGGKVNIPDIPQIQKFADGGLVKGKNVLSLLNDGNGQEFVMNAESTRKFFPILQAMNANRPIPNQTDNRQINSGNTVNYINYSGSNKSFTPAYMG